MADYVSRIKKDKVVKQAIPPYEPKKKEKMQIPVGAIAAIIIIVLIAGIMAFILEPGQKGNNNGKNISIFIDNNSTYLPPENCDEECRIGRAINESNLTYCKNLNETNSQRCYMEVAAKSLDACILVEDTELRKNCIYKHAKEQKSVEICNNLQNEERNSCIIETNPCYYQNYPEKNVCMALFEEDYRFCEKDENCIFEFIKEHKEEKACEEIDDLGAKSGCNSVVKQSDECQVIEKVPEKDQCYNLYATKTGRKDICTKISTDGFAYIHDCYLFFAVQEKNPAYCIDVPIDENKRWECYKSYSAQTGDLLGCESIEKYAKVSKNNCYFDVAKIYKNPTICEYLETYSHQDQCYVATLIRQDVENIEYCPGIKVDNWRNRCYTSIARRDNNAEICKNIQTSAERDLCVFQVKNDEEELQ